MSAPDALGNGVGRYDGILRCWLNDELVFERTDLRFRHHPDIHVNEVWMDHFHGGTTPPEAVHPFAHWGMVVAKKRIGMINLGRRPSQRVSSPQRLLISKNTIRQANPCQAERERNGTRATGRSGNRRDGEHYGRTGLADLESRRQDVPECWRRRMFPWPGDGISQADRTYGVSQARSRRTRRRGSTGIIATIRLRPKWCLFADGVAAIGHTYDTTEWVPAAWGITGPKGGFILPVRDVVYGVGSCYRPVICDLETKQWKKAASRRTGGHCAGDATQYWWRQFVRPRS